MDTSPKYLVIMGLIDGQNFTLPDGCPDKIEATVFAEAKFGNESILRSDPIKLTNSNPEFVTDLAWQLDKRSLHQMRVERRAIKLQIFMQTKRKKKLANEQTSGPEETGSSSHKIELIGYTVVDIRSAQESDKPKFKWVPLLNPKYRKPCYNRPEIQLALTLARCDGNVDTSDADFSNSSQTQCANKLESLGGQSESLESDNDSLIDGTLYKTCLDLSLNPDKPLEHKEEILENDIKVGLQDGRFYMYDASSGIKNTIDDCDEAYKITITIPFNSELDSLAKEPSGQYYFTATLFGSSLKSNCFTELTSVISKTIEFYVLVTDSKLLAIYFELNSSLVVKLHSATNGEALGFTTIQLDQLYNSNSKCRSLEGIFALQSTQESQEDYSPLRSTIGISVILERVTEEQQSENLIKDKETMHKEMTKEYFGEDIDEYLSEILNDNPNKKDMNLTGHRSELSSITLNTTLGDFMKQEDHHFCFTIDLKNFSYTPEQRLIPTLRELVVRYSYPFFGYKDTITTDASVPISPTNSIIVNGFCEFNFATTSECLLAALREIPLNLMVLTCDHSKRVEPTLDQLERVVATSSLNISELMRLNEDSIKKLQEQPLSTTVSAPIMDVGGKPMGLLQLYLSLKDLGQPSYKSKCMDVEGASNITKSDHRKTASEPVQQNAHHQVDAQQLESFLVEVKSNLDFWKEDYCQRLSDEVRRRENERFRRLTQRLEVKESKRDQEHKRKMDDLHLLEKKLLNSLTCIENIEKRLLGNFELINSKNSHFEARLDALDVTVSKLVQNNNQLDNEKRIRTTLASNGTSSAMDPTIGSHKPQIRISAKPLNIHQERRGSLKNSTVTPGIPLPVRSTSLVRGPSDGLPTKLIKRPPGVVTTVVNGTSASLKQQPHQRSGSGRWNLSRETQEKLANLRKEKAELLKRGCRPNDDLIQEINSLIEKLACC